MSDSREELVTRLLALLGLANKAGRLALGYSAVAGSVRRGNKPLVLVATDIGPAQHRKIAGLEPVVDIIEGIADRKRLGSALGRQELAVVGVEDRNFIRGILNLFET